MTFLLNINRLCAYFDVRLAVDVLHHLCQRCTVSVFARFRPMHNLLV